MESSIETLLSEERSNLAELRTLTEGLSSIVEFDEEFLTRVIERRSELMLDLNNLEKTRETFFTRGGYMEGVEDLARELRSMATELAAVEVRASENLTRIMGEMKNQVAGFERGLSLVQGYGAMSAHLSRFADRRG